MSETTYEKIFEVIQSSLVPKSKYEESQKEISVLKSALETVKNDLEFFKSKYKDQKQTIDILNAEKETLQSQKSTCDAKLKEVSLKLELKTRQYDLLLKSNETDSSKNATEKASAGTQTIKEEPIEIGIVNTPTASSSRDSLPDEPSVTEKRSLDADHDKKQAKQNEGKLQSRKLPVAPDVSHALPPELSKNLVVRPVLMPGAIKSIQIYMAI